MIKTVGLTFCLFFLVKGGLWAQNNKGNSLQVEVESTLIDPQQIVKVGEGHYFIDFGKAAFGQLELITKTPLNDSLLVHFGERVTQPYTIDRNPEGTIRYLQVVMNNVPLNSSYIVPLKADRRNSNPPAVLLNDAIGVIMPFRYVEIERLNGPITDLILRQRTYHAPFNDQSSSFSCSDTVLNQVWDLCKYTIKATSFCGVYVDGDRERIPYEADAFINQLSHYCVDSHYNMARQTNDYFIHHPTWPTEWILHTVLLFYYDYLYTGDLAPLAKHYEALKHKTLFELAREDGLISSKSEKVTDAFMASIGFANEKERIRDIVDWPPAQRDTQWKLATPEGERDGYELVEINTVVNAFYYINLKLMAEIANVLGKSEDALFFQTQSEKVMTSINQKLMDKTKGIYVDGETSQHSSLHANLFPLAFGLVPEEQLPTVVGFIKSRGMACSVYGAQFLLDGLYLAKEADYALGLMTAQTDRSWWNMIRKGSTMTLEAWDMKYKPNADWNHAWGAAPANIITRHLWGITPAVAGFSQVKIEPQMSQLTFSQIKVPTPKGSIVAHYQVKRFGRRLYSIELPQGVTGTFVLPQGTTSKHYLDLKREKAGGDTLPLVSGLNTIKLKIVKME